MHSMELPTMHGTTAESLERPVSMPRSMQASRKNFDRSCRSLAVCGLAFNIRSAASAAALLAGDAAAGSASADGASIIAPLAAQSLLLDVAHAGDRLVLERGEAREPRDRLVGRVDDAVGAADLYAEIRRRG